MDQPIYTDKMLTRSFTTIADGFQAVDTALSGIEQWMHHIEGHLAELGRKPIEVAVKMPKSRRVLPFVAGAVVGIYVYKRIKENGHKIEVFVNDKLDAATLKAQQENSEPSDTTPAADPN